MDLARLTPDEILDGHLLGAVKGDVYPLVYSKKVHDDAGFFGAMQLILTLTDVLGGLYVGEKPGKAKNAVKYIRYYMGKIDHDYKKAGGLIYVVWRHGTVHYRQPIKIKMNSRTVTNFGIDKNSSTKGVVAAKGHLLIHLVKFYEDFVKSVELFLDDIKSSPTKLRKMRKGWNEMLKAEDWNSVKQINKYLKTSDYEFVCKRKP